MLTKPSTVLIVAAWGLLGAAIARAADGPDPVFEKPVPVTMSQLAQRTTQGVSAVEVNDYAPGRYTGPLTPSPPHADMNAKRAVVVFWKDRPCRFVFSHEASYCPVLELPSGAALCNQFFEGNLGDAELFNTHAIIDLYSDRQYDVYWGEKGEVRRRGDDATLAAIGRSPGCAMVLPFREGLLFAVLGSASGFPSERNQLVDHCTPGAEGGCAWGAGLWDHWPIGWLNSHASYWKPGSPYAYSFGSVGQFFVPDGKRIKSFGADYPRLCQDMQLNRWTASRVFCVLLGAARQWDDIRRIGRTWLDQGPQCARPESIAHLK